MPDNAIFYHAAYITAAVVYGGYIVSLAIRTRRALARRRRQEDRATLQGRPAAQS
jgi:hypothetical protein